MLGRGEAELLETRDLPAERGLVGEIRERISPPERQALVQGRECCRGIG